MSTGFAMRNKVQSLDRALDILKLLGTEPDLTRETPLKGSSREAQTPSYLGYGRAGSQCGQRVLNCRIETRPEMVKEHLFEDTKP